MSRRVVTADDVLRVAAAGGRELVLGPADRLTPLAHDVLRDKGITLVRREPERPLAEPAGGARGRGAGHPVPRLTHVQGVSTMALGPFPVDVGHPEMDVRLSDVVAGRDGMPMAAGVMSLREGSFPWTLGYDEIEYVLEGELHITTAEQRVIGRPGDVIAIPRGSAITFGTPSWARFLYVTYPADWGGGS